jgi:hypothetical protein
MGFATEKRAVWSILAIMLATGPALAGATLSSVESIIETHGWPCNGVTEYREVNHDEYEAKCANGRTYFVQFGPAAGQTSKPRETSLQPLIQLGTETRRLASPDPTERRSAATELGGLGPKARLAAGPLTLALRDPDPTVRLASVQALAAINATDPAALAALEKARTDQDGKVKEAAVGALLTLRGN